jgi:hypothetical protein
MKIGLSEKQYKTILTYVSENQEVREDEEVPSAEPEAGTSSTQSGGQGYPEVGKWESGVTRGPANQVGITKWSDVVGSTLKRDKANQLKEQSVIGAPSNGTSQNTVLNGRPEGYVEGEYSLWSGTPTKTYKTVWDEDMKIPDDGTIEITLWKNEDDRLRIFSTNKNYRQDGKWYLRDGKTETIKPTKEWMDAIIPTNSIRFIKVINENKTFSTTIALKNDVWNVRPGYTNGDEVYDWEEYVTRGFKQWWADNWEMILTIVASAVAGILTGGASIWVQAAWQAVAGVGAATFAHLVTDPKDRDNVGYGINIILSFVPYMSAAGKIGIKAPLAGLSKIAPELNKAQNWSQVYKAIKGLSPTEQILATRMIQQVPKEFNREFKTTMMEGFVKLVRSGKVKLSKIPFAERMWWKQLAAETGVQLILGTVLSLPELRERFDKIIERATSTKEELEKKKIQDENTKKLIDKQKQIINKTFSVNEKYKNFDLNVYMEVIAPILDEYYDLGSPTNSLDNNLKYLEISETLLIEYKKNPKADLSTIIKTKYGKNE